MLLVTHDPNQAQRLADQRYRVMAGQMEPASPRSCVSIRSRRSNTKSC